MASWSDAAHALPSPQPRERPKPKRRRSPASARRHGVAGGVVWIAIVAVLLAGVVALNVAVLRLNVELSKVNAERTRLKADKQAIASQLSLAAATSRIQTLAARDGLVPADPTQTAYIRLRLRAK
jgi:cell division septal protein FtsQ